MKAEKGGQSTNWSQRCITCKDSWVCGNCYHKWDILEGDKTQSCYNTMPCVFCKVDMNYSNFVNRFDEGTGVGWWDYMPEKYWGSLGKLLSRNVDN